MNAMRLFQAAVFAVSKFAGRVSAAILVAMVAHVILEIALRGFFHTSTFVLDEYVGYGVAAMTYLSLAYAFEEGSLIRVNLVLVRLRGRLRRIVEYFCVVATLGVTVFVAAFFWRSVKRNWDRGAVSESMAETPLWIPEALVFVGLALFAVQLLAYLLRLLGGEQPMGANPSVDLGAR